MLATRKARRLAKAGDVDGPLDLLAHGKRRERRAAARQLGETGDERALEPLIAALEAAYFLAHREAILALADRGVFEPLEEVSRDHTRDRALRAEAKGALRARKPKA